MHQRYHHCTKVFSTTVVTPRYRPRAILKDLLSSLVPKEGTGRAPSQAQDSEDATDSKCALALISEAEFKSIEKWCSYSNSCCRCLWSSGGIGNSADHCSRATCRKGDSAEMPEGDRMEDTKSEVL